MILWLICRQYDDNGPLVRALFPSLMNRLALTFRARKPWEPSFGEVRALFPIISSSSTHVAWGARPELHTSWQIMRDSWSFNFLIFDFNLFYQFHVAVKRLPEGQCIPQWEYARHVRKSGSPPLLKIQNVGRMIATSMVFSGEWVSATTMNLPQVPHRTTTQLGLGILLYWARIIVNPSAVVTITYIYCEEYKYIPCTLFDRYFC